MPLRASSRGDAERQNHARKRAASPFGAPFSFGTPLRLNSQPPPRSKRAPSRGAPRRVLDVLDNRDPRRPRPNADGYGVTAPGRYPDLDAPFVSIVKETSKAPNPTAAAATAAVPAARATAGDASAAAAVARAAATASADAVFARGEAARFAAAKAAPRVAFGGRPSPKRASLLRSRGGAGARLSVAAAAAARRPRRFRRSASGAADSDSSPDRSVRAERRAGGGKDGGANGGAFGAGPAYSFGARTPPVRGASLWWGLGAGADASPGPGAYSDASSARSPSRVGASGPKFTFGARVGPDWASSGPGKDAPAPGSYFRDLDAVSRNVRDSANGARGAAPSFTLAKRLSPGGASDVARGGDAPGPGRYDAARPGEGIMGGGPAFTMGGGAAGSPGLGEASPSPSPGPGAYDTVSAGVGSDAPAFTMYARVPDVSGMRMAASVPGPGHYAPEVFPLSTRDAPAGHVNPGRAFLWAPKGYTFGRRGASGEEGVARGGGKSARKRAETARTPGPGAYETARSELRSTGATAFGAPPRLDSRSAGPLGPGPGEYEPDEAPDARRTRGDARTAVDIRRGTARDAPGGAFGRVGADATPGPGEFELDGEAEARVAARRKRRGAVDIGRSSARDAPGGVFDGAGAGGDATPGPGAFHPKIDERGVAVRETHGKPRGPVDMGKTTGRSAAGGAFDTRDGPGPGEHHPDLVFDDAEAALSPGAALRRKGVRSSEPHDAGKEKARSLAAPGPGPGEYEAARSRPTGAATIPKAPRRSSLVPRDATSRPGPADYEPEDDAPHPLTIAGLLRQRMVSRRGGRPWDAGRAGRAAASRGAARRAQSPPRRGGGGTRSARAVSARTRA